MCPKGLEQCFPHSRCSVKISSMNDEGMNSPYITSYTPIASTINFMMNSNPCLQLRPHFQAPDQYVSIWPLSITIWTTPKHLKLKISKIESFSSTSLPKPLLPMFISISGVALHTAASQKLESYPRLLSFTCIQSITYPTYFSHLIFIA